VVQVHSSLPIFNRPWPVAALWSVFRRLVSFSKTQQTAPFIIESGIDISAMLMAFEQFHDALHVAKSDLEKAGTIHYFKFTYELVWKTLKRVLAGRGKDSNAQAAKMTTSAVPFQLQSKHFNIVRDILQRFDINPFVFGSRVKASAKPLSDLDLCLKGEFSKSTLRKLQDAFEEPDLQFKVDIVVWSELGENFQIHITPDLTLFFGDIEAGE
jgi:uncharacterized protein